MRRFGLLVLGSAAAAGLALPRTPLRRRRSSSVRGGADASSAVKPFSAELKPQRASAKDVFATAARHAWPKGDWPQHALVVAAVVVVVVVFVVVVMAVAVVVNGWADAWMYGRVQVHECEYGWECVSESASVSVSASVWV